MMQIKIKLKYKTSKIYIDRFIYIIYTKIIRQKFI